METIRIPKSCILELIKRDTTAFYEPNLYEDITAHISKGYTSYDHNNKLYMNENDLAFLLFDRVYFSDSLTIIVF